MEDPSKQETKGHPKPSLMDWVQRLSVQDMPVFAHSARMLQELMERSDAGMAEMANIIQRDPVLAAKLMRVANSAYYNQSGIPVGSVQRAILVLGMDAVKQLYLTVTLMDSLVTTGPLRDRVDQELARALHAAFQAKAIAQRNQDASPEEIFVATLLVSIGNLAFWCFGGKQAIELDMHLRKGVSDLGQIQKEVAGFRLFLLSSALADAWKLPQLLQQALHNMNSTEERIKHIQFAWQFAQATDQGWFTRQARTLGVRFSVDHDMSLREAGAFLAENTAVAAAMTREMGAISTSLRIPLAPLVPSDGEDNLSIFDLPPPIGRFPVEDAQNRLDCLKHLATVPFGADFGMFQALELLAESVRNGCGMDRVLVAMPDSDGILRSKVALGETIHALEREFHWDSLSRAPNAFNRLMEEGGILHVRTDLPNWKPPILPSNLGALLQGISFVALPLVLLGRSIGLWYADRLPSGRILDTDSARTFQTFLTQGAALLEARIRKTSGQRVQ